MTILSFSPTGNTINFTAASSAPTSVQASINADKIGFGHYRIVNSGSVTVFIGAGATAAQATANAVVATSPPILPGAVEIMRFSPNFFFTAITASGTAVVYVTPGEGI